ncbi:MAG: acetate kinase, partial [Clostridiales bacterium]|nr:acetate kinase [Clostridiales bacterium]
YMGVKLDKEKNNALASYKDVKEGFINADDSKVKVIVIPTNEELMIAMDTEEIVSAL